MKLLDYIFKPHKMKEMGNYFKMLDGYTPIYSSFRGGVYEMDMTRTAINNFATHCSKLKPEVIGSANQKLKHVLAYKPNMLMDTTKFLARIATILSIEHTVFIIPLYNEFGVINGYYPIRPTLTEVLEQDAIVYLRYTFANGEKAAIEFDRVGIITSHQYKSDLFGEKNTTLQPTMELIHASDQSIINAAKNSANIRFLAKIQNMIKADDIEKERNRFTKENLSANNESGMIIYDNKFSDIKPIESKPYTPNALQMQQIKDNVCTHFGTNMDILQNKFTPAIWNAYYESKIESFALQLSLVLTNMTFTDRERAHGNEIVLTSNRMQYDTSDTKLAVSTSLFDRGLLTRNGVMDIWNMAHVPDGDKYYIRKEYAEVGELGKNNEGTEVAPVQQVNEEPEEDTDANKEG